VSVDALEYFCVGAALLYHEARHVRHVKGLPDAASWGALKALPDDRGQAWTQVRPLLERSRKAKTPSSVCAVFEGYFRRSLADLERLFREASWPRQLGGPKWASAAAAVQILGVALDGGDSAQVEKALAQVKAAQHNTGTLMEKYRRLESGR
jgi:hypothetical protein